MRRFYLWKGNKHMKTTKRALSLVLMLAMLCSLLAGIAFADSTQLVFTDGAATISSGGEYTLAKDSTGTITVSTTDPVTITGRGISTDEKAGEKFTDLLINCSVAGVNLAINNLYLSVSKDVGNIINFTGAGNVLTLSGTNLIENTNYGSKAMIHVGATDSTSLTIGGSGTLYLYKYCAGAGIGGNASEANGAITVTGGTLLIKGSKTGPLIGNDTCGDATKEAQIGNISITGGDITLIPKAQGAGIGGSRMSIGGNVYISGGTLTVISDFATGIGAGGQKVSTASYWGNLYMTGGSLRAVRTNNSLLGNSDSATQTVDDSLITPNRFTAPAGSPIYKFAFDTSKLTTAASNFTALVDGLPTIPVDYINTIILKAQPAQLLTSHWEQARTVISIRTYIFILPVQTTF